MMTDTEIREYKGYCLKAVFHAPQWQVHAYPRDRRKPLPLGFDATFDAEKERAFQKLKELIDRHGPASSRDSQART